MIEVVKFLVINYFFWIINIIASIFCCNQYIWNFTNFLTASMIRSINQKPNIENYKN